MNAALPRRLLAEVTGTGLLVAGVVRSGIAATRLIPPGSRADLRRDLHG